MTMRTNHYQALGPKGFHTVHYTEWGDPHNPRVLLCAHGLIRTGRDFDFLAEALEGHYRVICPDIVGRGKSDWLADKSDYTYPLYVSDLATLLTQINAESVDWVGTSMGGLIGMFIASHPQSLIRKLVVNDVGPRIPAAGLQRIAAFLGQVTPYDSLEAMEGLMRMIAAPFGQLTDAQWRHMTFHCARQLEDGRYALAYDPGIADNFKALDLQDVDLWHIWEYIQCPTLVLRGALSDVLEREDAVAMTQRGPKATLIELPGMGHAPALMADDQIAIVKDWLLGS